MELLGKISVNTLGVLYNDDVFCVKERGNPNAFCLLERQCHVGNGSFRSEQHVWIIKQLGFKMVQQSTERTPRNKRMYETALTRLSRTWLSQSC